MSPDPNVFSSVAGVDAPGRAGPGLLPPGPACSSDGLSLPTRLLTDYRIGGVCFALKRAEQGVCWEPEFSRTAC